MGVDWIVLGVVVLFILLDTGLIIAFIKQCEDHEMELLRDIYEETHPKKEEKKPDLVREDIPIIDLDNEELPNVFDVPCDRCARPENGCCPKMIDCSMYNKWPFFLQSIKED